MLILLGKVPPANRLSTPETVFAAVGLATAAITAWPRLLVRINKIKLSGFELELNEVRQQQRRQRDRIDEIDMLLPLLMPDAQFRHLENLLKGATRGYSGGLAVCDELRRLAERELVRRRPGRTIASLGDNRELDLADYVELTEAGVQWGNRYIAHKQSTAHERSGAEPVVVANEGR